MTEIQSVIVIIIAAALIIGCLKIFFGPAKLLLKLLLNTILGFVALVILNFVGAFIGISIGINWLNAIIVGIFGVPGVALLLILQWLLLI